MNLSEIPAVMNRETVLRAELLFYQIHAARRSVGEERAIPGAVPAEEGGGRAAVVLV